MDITNEPIEIFQNEEKTVLKLGDVSLNFKN